jgi:Druantia protein DruA
MGSEQIDTFCGQTVSSDQISEIVQIVSTFPKLSRTELANTICELFEWKRPNGKLKTVECYQFLERLDATGIIKLPTCNHQFARRTQSVIDKTSRTRSESVLSEKLSELAPLSLKRVRTHGQRQLWYEYVDRYHYLGYRIPFGAQLRYFIQSDIRQIRLGCLQFSSPAWRMAARDHWIGWSDKQRKANLQKIINNSRFLIFPWVQVKNLASSVLSLAVKTVPDDWSDCYGCRPALLETLVDRKQYSGTCYKAANWIYVGKTTGRGRMDRENKRQGEAVKDIYIYPLSKNFRSTLMLS